MFNSKKLVVAFVITVLSLSMIASGALAHDFWLNAKSEGKVFKAEIGYGHDFPNPEPIPEKRIHLFEKHLLLHTPKEVVEIPQKGKENYEFQVEKELPKGSYLFTGKYLPTYWSKGPDGWKQEDKKGYPTATYSELAVMFAKTVLNVDGYVKADFTSKPLGDRLEIVPLVNPATVHPGSVMPLQVLLDGKPLKTAEVQATFAGFSENKEYKAFVGHADLEGKVNMVVLKEGYWLVKVKHVIKNEDTSRADETVLVATLTFHINK